MIDFDNDIRVQELGDALENNLCEACSKAKTLSEEISSSDYYHCFNQMIFKYRNTKHIADIFISMWRYLDPWTWEKFTNNRFVCFQANLVDVQMFVDIYISSNDYDQLIAFLDVFKLWERINESTLEFVKNKMSLSHDLNSLDDLAFINIIAHNPYYDKPLHVLNRSLSLIASENIIFEDVSSVFVRYCDDGIKFSYRSLIGILESDLDNDVKSWFVHSFCDDPYSVTFVSNRHYANAINIKRSEMLKRLVLAPVSLEEKVFLYFNSKMKKIISISDLIEMILKYSNDNVIDCVRDYWISGHIKYVSNDGFVRIVSNTVSFELLPAFNSNSIRINDLDGTYKQPEQDLSVVFKIKDYLPEKKLILVHYVCTEAYYLQNYNHNTINDSSEY